MSDSIQALNEIVSLCGQREANAGEKTTINLGLLEKIVEAAGDCLEEHVAASNRAKPRKERVYREIVRQIAMYFCDGCDTDEGAAYTEEGVREVLAAFDITTVDFTGQEVKIV